MPLLDPQALYRCAHHAERSGYGVCRRCGNVQCERCAAFVDHVLTCASCVEARARAEQTALFATGDTTAAHLLYLALGATGSTVALYLSTVLYR